MRLNNSLESWCWNICIVRLDKCLESHHWDICIVGLNKIGDIWKVAKENLAWPLRFILLAGFSDLLSSRHFPHKERCSIFTQVPLSGKMQLRQSIHQKASIFWSSITFSSRCWPLSFKALCAFSRNFFCRFTMNKWQCLQWMFSLKTIYNLSWLYAVRFSCNYIKWRGYKRFIVRNLVG